MQTQREPTPSPHVLVSRNDVLAQALVDAAALDPTSGMYFVGNFSGRINFFAQQVRSLNLIWALLHTSRIREHHRVAVVGGGLAGVTAAVGLLNKNIMVELFEQYHELFHLQRNNITRHVHPSVNFWPAADIFPSTAFPFLNWYESTPAQIVSWLESEIDNFFSDIRTNHSIRIESVSRHASGLTLNATDGRTFGPFDVVIAACGFGLETPFPGTPIGVAHSYWENEDLFPLTPPGSVPTLFVSGSGDGALIEVIRGSLKRFQNGREIIELAKMLDRSPAKSALRTLFDKETKASHDYWISDEPLKAYLAIPVPPSFNSRLGIGLSNGSEIILNTRTPGVFGPNSAIVHRIIVAHLIGLGRVKHVVGDLVDVQGSARPFMVTVDTARSKAAGTSAVYWKQPASRILIRHGASKSLDWALDLKEQGRLAERQQQQFANAIQQQWADDYFNDAGRFPPFRSSDYVQHYLSRAREYFVTRGDAASVSIGKSRGRYTYVALCENERARANLPSAFFGVELIGRVSPADVRAYSTDSEAGGRGRGGGVLRPGMRAVLRGDDDSTITLPCFVSSSELRRGVIAPIHNADTLHGLTVVSHDGTVIGRLARTAPLGEPESVTDKPKRPGHSSVGLFELDDRIAISANPEGSVLWTRVASQPDIYDAIGEEVLKYNARSGLTRGRLSAIEVNTPIVAADGTLGFYDGLFEVRGRKGRTFSRPGDSGSIVFSRKGLLLGMIIAGADNGNLTYCAPLSKVLESLSCQIVLDETELSTSDGSRRGSVPSRNRSRIFISYARQDKRWVDILRQHLAPVTHANQTVVWDDTQIVPGTNWHEQIDVEISRAKVIVLVLSPSYFSSAYVSENELPMIMETARLNGTKVIAVPVEPTSDFAHQTLGLAFSPSTRPLSSMSPGERENAITRIATEIARSAV